MMIFTGAMVYRRSIISGSFFNPASFILTVAFISTVFYVFAIRSLYYVLTDKEILVYYMWGLLGKPYTRFHISGITSVKRSYLPFSSVSASIKGLNIGFKNGYKWERFFSTLAYVPIFPAISPVREKEFLEMLKAINPDIQINVTDKKGWWRFWDWDF